MAWTLAEVQTALTAAKATYLKMLSTPESQRSIDGRTVTQKDLDSMMANIDRLIELESYLLAGTGSLPGVAYADLSRRRV